MVRPEPLGSDESREAGLPACLRAADTDLDLCAEGDLDWVGAEQEVFARSACRFDVEEWWPSLFDEEE